MPRKAFTHIAVRFPPKIRQRLERRLSDRRQNDKSTRSLNAVIRTELEDRLPLWRCGPPILSQSPSAPRSELYLPSDLVTSLRDAASTADANLSDLVVTILATDNERELSAQIAAAVG